ncbi:MAG: hypothetical protein H0W09_03085, partial [Solirubrobacterales bacterium]|nr:hypothetical protein [Solirubrobacterales bacterium]
TEVDELALAASLSGTDRAESLGERLAESVRELRVLAERDREMCSRLERGFASAPLIVIPQLSAGAHDLAGLAGVAAHLVEPAGFQASSGERRA